MRKIELEHLLENAVARAISVKAPHANLKASRQTKKAATVHPRHIRHAA